MCLECCRTFGANSTTAHPYQIMVEDGNVHDIDATDKDRWCASHLPLSSRHPLIHDLGVNISSTEGCIARRTPESLAALSRIPSCRSDNSLCQVPQSRLLTTVKNHDTFARQKKICLKTIGSLKSTTVIRRGEARTDITIMCSRR
jgi:hypothetical protein